MTVQIVEGPGYYPDGKGGIVLQSEWGRDVTIECADCGAKKPLRLCSDEILSDEECDHLMDEYLCSIKWRLTEHGDRCPDCVKKKRGAR